MRFGSIGARLARFRQINRGSNSHHDALEFANGKIVLLTKLRPGQRATVLQLPAQREIDGKPLTAEQNRRPSVSRKGGEFASDDLDSKAAIPLSKRHPYRNETGS